MADTWRGLTTRERARTIGAVAASALFRWACFGGMILLSLLGEARPAPRVPDLLIDRIPYVAWVDHWNYWLWIAAYFPLGFVLLGIAPRRFCRFMVACGAISLLRGACVLFTGLGPVHGADVNVVRLAEPGMLWTAFRELVDPIGVLGRHSAHLYLTKDLFFSGHTATTFLLLLYLWPWRRLRRVMFLLHAAVVASLFLGHVHYTIDVVGAWAITFAVFALFEGCPGLLRGRPTEGRSPSGCSRDGGTPG